MIHGYALEGLMLKLKFKCFGHVMQGADSEKMHSWTWHRDWTTRTTNKASGHDGITAKLLKILKGVGVKVLHSICQQIWKTQQWPQDSKTQFSSQSQRRTIPSNVQATIQLHSVHILISWCPKSFKLGFSGTWTIRCKS